MRLSRTVFAISSKKIKTSRDSNHAPFRDNLSPVGWDLLCSTQILSLKCLRLPATKKWQATPNVKNSRFEPPFGGLRGNAHGSSMARWNRWKARCRLPISDNWTFLASCHDCGTIKRNLSKSAFFDGGGSLLAQILGRWGRRPQSVYGPLDRGTM